MNMVQVGFEPKIVFICPICNREVELIYRKDGWVADHANCLNFTVVKRLPVEDFCEQTPLVFVILESDYSIIEAIGKLREILEEEKDSVKKQRLEMGIKRMESMMGFSNKLQNPVELIKSSVFGLKIIVGRGLSAYVWKGKEKFFGIVLSEGDSIKSEDGIMITSDEEEAKKFIFHWLHYWEKINF